MKVTCDYCQRNAVLVSGNVIYPYRPDLFHKWFYRCEPCGAYVGCHPGSAQALGRLANAELRAAKMAAHAAFDPLWRNGGMSRSSAYAWLSRELGVAPQNCHIGMFDVDACRAVVAVCQEHVKQSPG